MYKISTFLPQYRELNTLLSNAINHETVSYEEQKTITEFYRQFGEVKAFDKMLLDIVLERDKPTCTLLLSGIKTEIENNIRLYESAKDNLNSINIVKICRESSRQYNFAIEAQLKATNKYSSYV